MSTTTMQGLAKELYSKEEIKKMEQLETELLNLVPEGKVSSYSPKDGGSFTFATMAYGPHGQKMTNEQENLPRARASYSVQGKSYVKEYVGILQFTKRELELAQQGDAVAFADSKTFDMEALIKNAHKYFNRQLAAGDGSGLITLVQGAQVAQTIIEVDDATPFQIGMVIDIYDQVTGLKVNTVDGAVITDIDYLSATHSIVIDQTITCADNSTIYLAGVHDNASTDGKEMLGIPLATDDGSLSATFQGITRTGAGEVPNYRGMTIAAGSTPISAAWINQAMTRAKRVAGVDFVKSNDVVHVTSPEQWRAYASLSTPQIRFMPSDSPDLNKPFTQYECMGKKVVVDSDLNRTSWFIFKKGSFVKRAVPTPLDWESDLGGTSLKWLSGTLQAVMVLYSLQQFYYPNPRDGIQISGLQSVSI